MSEDPQDIMPESSASDPELPAREGRARPAERPDVLRITLHAIVAVLLWAAAFGAFFILKSTRPEAPRSPQEQAGTLVEVITIERGDHEVTLEAHGTVMAAEHVVLSPELGGRVVWQSEALVPGRQLAAGEPIVRIDRRDYQLALEAQRAQLQRAELELQLEQGRQRIAQAEWQSFGASAGAEPTAASPGQALALREPHMRTAEVGLQAAESNLRRARINLGRTTLRAPFDAVVVTEDVEMGQLVGPQSRLATLVGTRHARVQISVPISALGLLELPSEGRPGANAEVIQEIDGQRVVRAGQITQMLPDLDPAGGNARLVVTIDDPFSLDDEGAELPLLLGSFVRVRLEAHPVMGAMEIPLLALREGNRVHVMNSDARLEIREVEVAWRRDETALIRGDLSPGERVVSSRIGTAVAGMLLRLPSSPELPSGVAATDGAREGSTL